MSDKETRIKQRRLRTIIGYSVLGALVVALSLYLIFRNTNQIQYRLPDVASVSADSIDEIRIVSDRNGIVELHRQAAGWVVGEAFYPVAQTRIDAMLDAVESFHIAELVSTAKYYERYELDDANKLDVIVSGNGEELLRFAVGKRSPTYNHTYIKLPDDDRVFQAQGNLSTTFDRNQDSLRDKVVLELTPDNIVNVGVTNRVESYRVYRVTEDDSTIWKTDDDYIWDVEAIDSALDRMAKLECESYLDSAAAAELSSPELVLEIQADEVTQLYIYAASEGSYTARTSQVPYAFRLSSYTVERIREAFDRSFVTDN